MTRGISVGAIFSRFASVLLILFSATAASGARPLPMQVVADAPGIHPIGNGRHTWWGIQMYDATLWTVGPNWSAARPHALDLEPGRAVPADTLVKNAIAEMRDMKIGDESKIRSWQAEMTKLIPNVQKGDQFVIFCSETHRTIAYLNNSSTGQIDDPSFCPAVMSVWLHPRTKHQAMRKSLLGH